MDDIDAAAHRSHLGQQAMVVGAHHQGDAGVRLSVMLDDEASRVGIANGYDDDVSGLGGCLPD